MKSILIISSAVALTACAPAKGPTAERRYELVATGGTATEKCFAARDTASAYLIDENAAAYRDWRLRSSEVCLDVSLDSMRP